MKNARLEIQILHYSLTKTAHTVASTGIAPITLGCVNFVISMLQMKAYHCGGTSLVVVDTVIALAALAGMLAILLTRCTLLQAG